MPLSSLAHPLPHRTLRRWARSLSLLGLLLSLGLSAQAQTSAQTPSAQPAQSIPPVATTITVQGDASDNYLPSDLSPGGFTELPIVSAPASITVITRDLMTDQVSRLLSDIVKNDASIGEDYAPVGYYGDFQIRGFPIDLATGLQINGMPIAGEQDVPLENKERVEFLKGIAGVESGITTAGGLIDYVTKRPAPIETLEMATDHRGSAYAALDFGALFGPANRFGLRINMAGEAIHTYVESANGWRGLGALSTGWKLSSAATLKTDFEYQHKRERSVAGYQLLGGTVVPALNRVHPSVMLGDQPWSKPNIFDSINAGSRLDLDLASDWHVYYAASYSHSLIDDNVIYPYGAAYDANGNDLCPDAPYYFFCPDGSYSIYDYRDPGERRIDALGEGIASGRIQTGPLSHQLTFGGAIFHRGVDLPGQPAMNAPANVVNGAVYAYLGWENIYQSNIPYAIETPVLQAGPLALVEANRQSSGIVQDRVEMSQHLTLTAGGRYVSMGDSTFTGHKSTWLPQYSAAWTPVASVTYYGSYNVLLSPGPQAPFWALNGSEYLAPFFTRQAEVGAKFEPGHRILLSTAFFRMRAPFFYPRLIAAPDKFCAISPGQCFESDGRETHQGIEAAAQGRAARWLHLSATAAVIRALSDNSATQSFNGKQVINEPRFKTAFFTDIALPSMHRLHLSDIHLMPGWSYTARKAATRDDRVSVAGYNIFNLGARYTPGGEAGRIIFHLYADNILDKRYWKDTGASYGDTFLHLGAPATVRLSGQYRF